MVLLILNSSKKSENFAVEYDSPLRIKKIALQSFSMWVSWHNISEKYKNNTFSLFDGLVWIDYKIPNGNYTIRDLNQYMVKVFGTDPPIQFGVVRPRNRVAIKLKDKYKIDLSKSNLYKILGFESKIYEDDEQEGKYIANLSNGNDNIFIHCNIINGARINQFTSEVIYSFTNTNPPGSQITKEFFRPLFFPVKHDNIYRIEMRITNQKGELIDLNDEEVEYNLITENF